MVVSVVLLHRGRKTKRRFTRGTQVSIASTDGPLSSVSISLKALLLQLNEDEIGNLVCMGENRPSWFVISRNLQASATFLQVGM